MDGFLVLGIAALLVAGASCQAPEVNATTPIVTEGKPCVTARNISGSCILRQNCDYSTYAIDLSLYSPSWYKRTCTSEEVCCPPDSVLPPQSTSAPEDENFDFTDDD